MNPHAVSSNPNLEVPSLNRQQLKYSGDDETRQTSVAPSSRYQRRSSVTRYSLDQMTTEPRQGPLMVKKQGAFETPVCQSKNENTTSVDPVTNESAPSQDSVPRPRGGRYGRRSSVTRYSISQTAPNAETRSLSPVPLARRASITKVTVEKYKVPQGLDNTTIDKEPTVEPPRGRYRRRCSVTKYCLEDAQKASTVVMVTVEEPLDTVESIEHRNMLANDTVESAGAGDLIVGWNQAGADFWGSDDDCDIGRVADGLICDFGVRQQVEKEPATPEKGSYFRAVLSHNFPSAQLWFKALDSEALTSSNEIDELSSSIGSTTIHSPSPIR